MDSATINGRDFASVTFKDGTNKLILIRECVRKGLFCIDGYSFPFGTKINLHGIPYKINNEFSKKKMQRNGEKRVLWYLERIEF